MEILSRETREIISNGQIIEAIDLLLTDRSIREVEVILPSGKKVKLKKLLV